MLFTFVFFASSMSIFAAWTITKPQHSEEFLPYSNIDTGGEAPAETDIVIKLKLGTSTGASHDMQSEEENGNWEWDFPAPPGEWTVSDDWTVNLYLDENPLANPQRSLPYEIIEDDEG